MLWEVFALKCSVFKKIWFFQIFDRSKLRLKIWFEYDWLDCYSIDAGSIEYVFRSIEPIFWPIENLLLRYLRYRSLCTLMMRPLLLMTLCHISPILSFSGVLILGLSLMSWSRFITCFSGFLVIPFGPSLTCTPFL